MVRIRPEDFVYGEMPGLSSVSTQAVVSEPRSRRSTDSKKFFALDLFSKRQLSYDCSKKIDSQKVGVTQSVSKTTVSKRVGTSLPKRAGTTMPKIQSDGPARTSKKLMKKAKPVDQIRATTTFKKPTDYKKREPTDASTKPPNRVVTSIPSEIPVEQTITSTTPKSGVRKCLKPNKLAALELLENYLGRIDPAVLENCMKSGKGHILSEDLLTAGVRSVNLDKSDGVVDTKPVELDNPIFRDEKQLVFDGLRIKKKTVEERSRQAQQQVHMNQSIIYDNMQYMYMQQQFNYAPYHYSPHQFSPYQFYPQ